MYRSLDGSEELELDELIQSQLLNPVYLDREGYKYLVSAMENFPLFVEPKLLTAICRKISSSNTLGDINLIVCVEASGIALGTALSIETGIPLAVIRKKQFGLDDERAFSARTNYAERKYFLNGQFAGRRIALIDDIAASGETLRQSVAALRSLDADVRSIFVLLSRGMSTELLKKELGIPVTTLAKVE